MNNNKKAAFDSLNNDINLLKDASEILEGVLELYKSLFHLKERVGNNRHFIIDYGIKIVEEYKIQWINIFDNLLIFNSTIDNLALKEIKSEGFNYIVYGMEKAFFKEYRLFLNTWKLELETFIERNSSIQGIYSYGFHKYEEEIEHFNVKGIKEIIENVSSDAYVELNYIIQAFNKNICIAKSDLKYFICHKDSMNLSMFNDEIIVVKEDIFDNIYDFQEKIKVVIGENLVKRSLEKINEVTEKKLNFIITSCKKELNRKYILEMGLKRQPIVYTYKNKLISKGRVHSRCGAVLECELKYLNFIRTIGVEEFGILEQEAEQIFKKVFNLEFYSVLYDVKFLKDFDNLIEGYKIKSEIIFNNITLELLKQFINKFNEIIFLIMKNRKYTIENLYIFKPINYMDNVNIYEPSEIIHLQKFLMSIYDNYNFNSNSNNEFNKIKEKYIGLNNEIINIVESFILSLEKIQIDDNIKNYFDDKKVGIYECISTLKNEIWATLNSRFIKVFNCFNDMVAKSIEELERELKLYEISITYIEY